MKLIKKIVVFILIFSICSCSLTKVERKITNDLINEKLQDKYYGNYLNKQTILIKEAGNGLGALLNYEQIFNDTTQINYKYQYWPLNKIQIQEQKKRKLRNHIWQKSDIDFYDFTIIDSKKNRENYRSQYYFNLPNEIYVLNISKPLIVNKNEALIDYCVTNKYGYSYDRCVILMNKSENNKWKIKSVYYDGNSSW